MDSFKIATIPHSNRDRYPDPITTFMLYVKETSNPVIKGLVEIMAGEIQHRRLDGRLYMGGKSTNIGDCVADSEVLLARVLLDHSSHGRPPGYVITQIKDLAWGIFTEEGGKDPVGNWLMAQRRYVRYGLEYLAKLQKPNSDKTQ